MDFIKELVRTNALMLWAQTGDDSYLKQVNKMGFNEPLHLPQPLPAGDSLVFDIHDDQLMRECIGGRLTKSVQALLVTLEQWDTIPREAIPDTLKLELMRLREAVKEEFQDL